MTGDLAAREHVTPAQQARRERILDAAVELATEGGYDAVQMREVAERADVALGTLYRYFPSKVHLLITAMGRLVRQLRDETPAAAEGTPQERVYRVVAATTRFIAEHRRLSGALVRALLIADTSAAEDVEKVGAQLVSIISSATRPPGEPADEHDILVALVIGKVWLADVVTLLSGRMTVSQVLEDLQQTIALVMRD